MDIFIPELGPACLTGVFRLFFQPSFLVRLFQFLMQPLAGFPSASRPVQFAPTWWDPSHCFGKRRKKKSHTYQGMSQQVTTTVRIYHYPLQRLSVWMGQQLASRLFQSVIIGSPWVLAPARARKTTPRRSHSMFRLQFQQLPEGHPQRRGE